MFPFRYMPQAMQRIGSCFPQRWIAYGKEFDLWQFRNRHPASLSGGQKQRVILAAALLRNRPILILDEPTSGLDGRHMRIIAEYLRRAAEKGTCILVITHDREFINIAADEVLEIH